MKAINSNEKSKKVWQFIIIFFALAVIPVAIIFLAYFTLPEGLTKAEQQMLMQVSEFEQSKKNLLKNMANIDTNLISMANAESSLSAQDLSTKVTYGILELKKDTSELTKLITNSYENYQKFVIKYIETKGKLDSEVPKLIKELKDCQDAAARYQSVGSSGNIPLPPGQINPH